MAQVFRRVADGLDGLQLGSITPPRQPLSSGSSDTSLSKKPGKRRSGEAISQIMRDVHATVEARPNMLAKDIALALGLAPSDIRVPLQTLVAAGRLRTTGVKQGTRYAAT